MHYSGLFSCLLLAFADTNTATPLKRATQKTLIKYNVDHDRAEAVKEIFKFAWHGYTKFAFPHDELHPFSKTPGDSRNGWGASAVDALSTAIIMELPDVINTITKFIPTINYNVTGTTDSVSLFETTIRYLGGMLAGYDLLSGPFEHLAVNNTEVDILLAQSKKLGDVLSFAFDTPSGIPDNDLDFTSRVPSQSGTNGVATIGTLVLEWTRLSDLTDNPKYGKLTQKAESYLLRPHPASGEPFPGLIGQDVSIASGNITSSGGGWVGGSDSFYEYLIKMWVYDNKRFAEYRDRWIVAADSSIEFMASHPNTRPDLTFLAKWEGRTVNPVWQHLGCFAGGNFILGGLVLGEDKYTDFGLELTAGCRATYKSTLTGIGPESFGWAPAGCSVSGAATTTTTTTTNNNTSKRELTERAFDPCAVPSDQLDFYKANGFYIRDSSYDLRPEVIESYYYAYRVTGDKKYQDWAWEAIQAINATTRSGVGFTAVTNVNVPNGGNIYDNQESFWFAEVLKYSYLIFSEDGPWQVNFGGDGNDEEFVFNTEAHPFKVAGKNGGKPARRVVTV